MSFGLFLVLLNCSTDSFAFIITFAQSKTNDSKHGRLSEYLGLRVIIVEKTENNFLTKGIFCILTAKKQMTKMGHIEYSFGKNHLGAVNILQGYKPKTIEFESFESHLVQNNSCIIM